MTECLIDLNYIVFNIGFTSKLYFFTHYSLHVGKVVRYLTVVNSSPNYYCLYAKGNPLATIKYNVVHDSKHDIMARYERPFI